MSSPNLKQAVPFFMVTDMDSSITFYVDGLGFEIKLEWKPEGNLEWCWLEREGVAVMLQAYRAGLRPEEKLGVGVSVYFICEDALKLYREFKQRGLGPAEPFVGNKMWVVSLLDPDGYALHFESVTNAPEETVYSEWIKSK
jgi:hypothetical protein